VVKNKNLWREGKGNARAEAWLQAALQTNVNF
jgi:hypothetical protein